MDDDGVTLLVASSLRFFLPARRRRPALAVPADGTSTIGHLLASVGVPRTEVGALLRNGAPVDLGCRPVAGDRISVLPRTGPQPTPTTPPRFLLDVHLGKLARRMRLLGLDTAYDRDAEDDALVQQSLTEQRVLLTRDRGLLHRRAVRWGAHVEHQQPDQQLREVLERFRPPLQPWSRCPRCNGVLRDVAKEEVRSLLADGTRRSYETFRRCAACNQVYWRGAHGGSLERIVDGATGRVEQP